MSWALRTDPAGSAGISPSRQIAADAFSAPSAVSCGPGRLDIFTVGDDGGLVHWWSADDGLTFSNVDLLGGRLSLDQPAAVSWQSGRLDVFARQIDGTLAHYYYGAGWGGPELVGGSLTFTGPPAAVSWAPHRLDIFARGDDTALWHWWYSDGGFGGPEPLGGVLQSPPTG